MKKTYSGGCQCGKVHYEVLTELGEVMACNCSRCAKLGWLLTFVPAKDFTLKSGEGATTDFQFNKHVIHHMFCSTCGIESFAPRQGAGRRYGRDQCALPGRRRSGVAQGENGRRPFALTGSGARGRAAKSQQTAKSRQTARIMTGELTPPVTFSALLPAAGNQDQTGHLMRMLVARSASRPIWSWRSSYPAEPLPTQPNATIWQ